jgi:hypothetical protein
MSSDAQPYEDKPFSLNRHTRILARDRAALMGIRLARDSDLDAMWQICQTVIAADDADLGLVDAYIMYKCLHSQEM